MDFENKIISVTLKEDVMEIVVETKLLILGNALYITRSLTYPREDVMG